MVWEADDRAAVKHLGRVSGPKGEHVRKDGRAVREEALIYAEGSITGEEDEIAVVEPEVGMASELLLAVGGFAWFPGGDDGDCLWTGGDATAFGGARVESHVTGWQARKEATKGFGRCDASWTCLRDVTVMCCVTQRV